MDNLRTYIADLLKEEFFARDILPPLSSYSQRPIWDRIKSIFKGTAYIDDKIFNWLQQQSDELDFEWPKNLSDAVYKYAREKFGHALSRAHGNKEEAAHKVISAVQRIHRTYLNARRAEREMRDAREAGIDPNAFRMRYIARDLASFHDGIDGADNDDDDHRSSQVKWIKNPNKSRGNRRIQKTDSSKSKKAPGPPPVDETDPNIKRIEKYWEEIKTDENKVDDNDKPTPSWKLSPDKNLTRKKKKKEEDELVIPANAPKFRHDKWGIGILIKKYKEDNKVKFELLFPDGEVRKIISDYLTPVLRNLILFKKPDKIINSRFQHQE